MKKATYQRHYVHSCVSQRLYYDTCHLYGDCSVLYLRLCDSRIFCARWRNLFCLSRRHLSADWTVFIGVEVMSNRIDKNPPVVQYSLRNHQIIGVEYLSASESFALFCEQGTGKTLMMLTRVKEILEKNQEATCLIVAPKAVLGAWSRDIQKFFPGVKCFARCTIINYDILHKIETNTYTIVVLDESHYIKNRATKRAKLCHKLSIKAKYRYIMTGTPINNGKLHEYWSQMAFLFPKIVRGRVIAAPWGSFTQFTKDYCILDQWFQPSAYKKVNEIQDAVSEISYRVLKKDCLELPPKLPDEIWSIEMTPQQKKLYKEMVKDSVFKEYGVVADNPLTKMLKLRQLSSGYLVDKNGISLPIANNKEKRTQRIYAELG